MGEGWGEGPSTAQKRRLLTLGPHPVLSPRKNKLTLAETGKGESGLRSNYPAGSLTRRLAGRRRR